MITNLPFHNGEVGIAYSAVSLEASGGTAPYQWSVGGGTFPPGLTISSLGTVTGKNTGAGHFNFTITLKDSAGGTASAPAGLGVFPALSVKQPCATQCTVGVGCQECGSFGSAGGGLAPYDYTLVGGAVPQGMTLSGLALKGAFPGSPLGAFNVSVRVTDQFGARATVYANWYVFNPATLSGGGDCIDPDFTGRCSATGWTYSGGNPTAAPTVYVMSWSPASSGPPPAFSAVARGGTITISAATPSRSCNSYDAVVTLVLLDSGHCATTMESNPVDIAVDLIPCGG